MATPAAEPEAGPDTMEEAEAAFAGLETDAPRVGIIMGSKSDMEVMEQAGARCSRSAGSATRCASCPPTASPTSSPTTAATRRCAGCGSSSPAPACRAALPGVAAAHTDLPVIGVPLSSRLSALGGLDAILSVTQMPPGVPVAAVGLDNAKNAGAPRGAHPRAAPPG